MKKIKDIFYNINDVIVAAIILVAAVAIILWRMNVILNYPRETVSPDPKVTEEHVEQVPSQAEDPAKESEGEKTGEGTEEKTGEAESGKEGEEKTEEKTPAASGTYTDGKLTKSVTVTLKGNTATQVVQCCIDKKLFKDYAEYKSICDELGRNDEMVYSGKFTFEKGMTKKEIVKKITIK